MTGDLTGKVTTVVDMADYIALEAERDRLVALLRAMEWLGSDSQPMCPSCASWQWKGHATDCRLAAALEGRDA